MNRRSFLALCGSSLGAGAGCLDRTAGEGRIGTSTATDTATPTPANETASFENLSRQRRRTFRAALERERGAADGWSFYNESRPTYVRYNGTWFRVFVAVH